MFLFSFIRFFVLSFFLSVFFLLYFETNGQKDEPNVEPAKPWSDVADAASAKACQTTNLRCANQEAEYAKVR